MTSPVGTWIILIVELFALGFFAYTKYSQPGFTFAKFVFIALVVVQLALLGTLAAKTIQKPKKDDKKCYADAIVDNALGIGGTVGALMLVALLFEAYLQR